MENKKSEKISALRGKLRKLIFALEGEKDVEKIESLRNELRSAHKMPESLPDDVIPEESIEDKLARLKKRKTNKCIYSVKKFNPSLTINRLYINIYGANKRFRGDRTYKVYYDYETEEMVFSMGRGITSDAFEASLVKFREFCTDNNIDIVDR